MSPVELLRWCTLFTSLSCLIHAILEEGDQRQAGVCVRVCENIGSNVIGKSFPWYCKLRLKLKLSLACCPNWKLKLASSLQYQRNKTYFSILLPRFSQMWSDIILQLQWDFRNCFWKNKLKYQLWIISLHCGRITFIWSVVKILGYTIFMQVLYPVDLEPVCAAACSESSGSSQSKNNLTETRAWWIQNDMHGINFEKGRKMESSLKCSESRSCPGGK